MKAQVVLLVLLCSALAVMAEVPTWEEFASQVFTVRQHYHMGYDGPHPNSGLWLFEPHTGEWRRSRPLDLAESIGNWYPYVEGISLATWGDSVLVQRFPTSYEFELPSLRLVRTFETMPQDMAWGWALHGTAVDPQETVAVGLDAGHYGFLTCSFTAARPWQGFGTCAELGFPVLDSGSLQESATQLVFRQHRATSSDFEVVTELSEWGGNPDWLTPDSLRLFPDPLRGGIWRQRVDSMELLTSDGSGGLTVSEERLFQEGSAFSPRHLHPWTDSLLAVTADQFVALDLETFEVERVYSTCVECGVSWTGFPHWMASLAASPPVEKLQTVPIVVDAPGRNGTRWRTTLWLYNPSAAPIEVELSRVTAPDQTHVLELPGHGSMTIDEPLVLLGGGPAGDGATHDAIQVRSEYRFAKNVVAVARVWTGDASGTFGQAVPAVPDDVGYSNHEAPVEERNEFYTEAWVVMDRRQPGRFRHNLGVVNASDEPLQVVLRWAYHTPRRSTVASNLPEATRQVVNVAANSVRMLHLEELFPQEIVDSWPSQVSVRATDQAIVWLSMVDNVTGDATFLPYTLRWLYPLERGESAIPAVTHAPGVGGVLWRTDLYGMTNSFSTDFPWALFHPATDNVCGGYWPGDELAQSLLGEMSMPLEDWLETRDEIGDGTLWPENSFRSVFPDVIRKFIPCEGEDNVRGALHLPASSWTSMFSRTYVERADGGTYGGMLPMYPHGGWPVQYFAGIEVSGDFRVNLGLYNANEEDPIVHRLTLHAADGSVAAETEVTVMPWQSEIRPLQDWLGIDSLPVGTHGLTVVPLDDSSLGITGRSWAFVSVIDNRTGDPTNWW